MRARPVISAIPGWRDGFVVGETHVLSAYQGQGTGYQQRPATAHNARTIRANLGYAWRTRGLLDITAELILLALRLPR